MLAHVVFIFCINGIDMIFVPNLGIFSIFSYKGFTRILFEPELRCV